MQKKEGLSNVACSRLGRNVAIKMVVFVQPDGNDTRPGFVECDSSLECGCGVVSGLAISYNYDNCPVSKKLL